MGIGNTILFNGKGGKIKFYCFLGYLSQVVEFDDNGKYEAKKIV